MTTDASPDPGPVEVAAAAAVRAVAEPIWWGTHLREVRWQAELARLLADPVWRGTGLPRGDGEPVLLIPGFLAGDQSLSVMATWLRRLGYRPARAGIAFNVRCSDTAVDRLERTLHHAHLSSGRKVAIVGHSRGGHFAKALASRNPDEVSQVISMGSGSTSRSTSPSRRAWPSRACAAWSPGATPSAGSRAASPTPACAATARTTAGRSPSRCR
jgi:pimeloyl-ACP methyl ester carboxylesterase